MPKNPEVLKDRKSREVSPAVKKIAQGFADFFRADPEAVYAAFDKDDAKSLQGISGNGTAKVASHLAVIMAPKGQAPNDWAHDYRPDDRVEAPKSETVTFRRDVKGEMRTDKFTCIRRTNKRQYKDEK